MLVRLLYASRAVGKIDCAAVQNIMHKSHAYNPHNGVTGILCHSDKVYMQVLEGGRDAINGLYAKILGDARHTDVVLLHYEEICERHYAGIFEDYDPALRTSAEAAICAAREPAVRAMCALPGADDED